MTHLLDTNTCIEYLRRPATTPVAAKLAAAVAGSVALCAVVVEELLYGGHRSAQRAQVLGQVRNFCARYASLPFDDRAAEECSQLRAYLANKGMTIGAFDNMIAAIALANKLTVVTHNTVELSRVPGLKIEDWQVP